MKITNFGRNEHRVLSEAITAALKTVGDRFGVNLVSNGGQYGTTRGVVRVSVELQDTRSGLAASSMEFRRMATLYGLQPDDFGRTFMFRGQSYKITGVNPSAPKYPINAERSYDSKGFRFHPSTVKIGLPMKAAA